MLLSVSVPVQLTVKLFCVCTAFRPEISAAGGVESEYTQPERFPALSRALARKWYVPLPVPVKVAERSVVAVSRGQSVHAPPSGRYCTSKLATPLLSSLPLQDTLYVLETLVYCEIIPVAVGFVKSVVTPSEYALPEVI